MQFVSKHRQTAVYWAPDGTHNKFGAPGYDGAVELTAMVRWQDTQDEFKNAEGQNEFSDAIVYAGKERIDPVVLVNEGRLYRGELADLDAAQKADPNLVDPVVVIRKVLESPTTRVNKTLIKCWTNGQT